MRSKLSWAAFIPLTLVAFFFKIARYIMPEGSAFGLSNLVMDYISLGAIVLILLFSLLFCAIDKKISAYYLPRRNFAAGVIGLALALIFAGEGANGVYRIIATGDVVVLKLIDSILLLVSAVVFVVLGLTHSLRERDNKQFVLFSIVPAILFAERMIACFVDFTTISLKLADVPKIACYIFATLFFFNYAVTLSLTKTKNAVKSCFIFGFPATASMLIYGISKLVFEPDTHVIVNNAEALEMILIAAYILAFLIELTMYVRDKDSVKIIEDDEELPAQEDIGDGITAERTADKDRQTGDDSSYFAATDTSDYLYRAAPDRDVTVGTDDDNEDYLTQATDESVPDDRPADYVSKIDKIDKLILEITEKTD